METPSPTGRTPSGTASRGRPPRISRDAILEAAVSLLEQDPSLQLSLNAIARVLKITPMAIYTYFASKDELLQALSERLLQGLDLEIPPGAAPLEKILLWSHAMRAHFLTRPLLIELLVWEGGHASISWLRQALVVDEALADLGLEGDDLARATLWVWQVVMGAIHVEIRTPYASDRLATEELQSLEPELRAKIERVHEIGRRPGHQATFFAYQMDRMLDALGLMKRPK
jgi:AcrR family transcriptional regulator